MKTITAVLAVGLLSTSSVIAETKTKTETPIVVTASRTAESVDETLASVSVITRNDIVSSQARELSDLLKLQAGIDLSSNGGPGNTTNVFLRGSNSNHTLFLIDGMRVASSTTGTFALESLSLDQIERIEIVRGPRATQYGSDAIGGIIHIFTRRNQSQHARIGFGSFDTHEGSAGISIGNKVKFNINASYEHAEGFSSTNLGNFSYDPDNDGYRKNNVSFGLSAPLGNDIEFSLRGLSRDNWTEFDMGTTNTEGQEYVANVKHQLSDIWAYTLTAGYNDEDVQTSSGNPSSIKTNRLMFDWQNDFAIDDTTFLIVGLSQYKDQAENINIGSSSVVFDQEIDNKAIFANFRVSDEKADHLISLRNDDHSNFGSHNSAAYSWGYTVAPSLRVTSTISNAFRAPTINELYHPGFDFGGGTFFFEGNPALEPEEASGGEVSARIRADQHTIQLTYFTNWIKNLIAYQGTNSQAINISRARTRGIELQHQWQQGKWATSTNVTLQRAYDDSDQDLLRRPRKKLSFVLKHQHSKHSSTRFEMLAASNRSDFGGANLPGYTIFNVGTRIKIDKHLWFDGRIDNLTNKQYELAENYNTADRSAFIGLSYELDK